MVRPETVRDCLSLMYSCGAGAFSGEWAYAIGIPCKNSESGALMVVVPNIMGACVYSPRLDKFGLRCACARGGERRPVRRPA